MVHFQGVEYRSHTNCVTEAQKYQGALYKDKKNKNANNKNNNTNTNTANYQQQPNKHKKVRIEGPSTPAAAAPPEFKNPHNSKMSHRAYVEELPDEPFDVNQFLQPDDEDDGVPPAAPSPPSARPLKEGNGFNVFDFMVGQATPNMSKVNIPRGSSPTPPPESHELVRYDFEANGFVDPDGTRDEDGNVPFVEYGTGEVPAGKFKTPAAGAQRKSKDKKRKRLHIDTNSPLHEPHRDEEMTDAPPMLHSGLTGGLNRLAVFPPSPDYSGSGGDGNEPSPSSPIKKKKAQKAAKQHAKQSKHAKARPESGGIFSRLKSSSNTTTKTKKRKTVSSPTKPRKSSTHHRRHSSSHHDKPVPKAIEYKSDSKNEDKRGSHAMIVYREPVDLFMSLVNKGPESERGCSLNKALKRFHRERQESSDCRGKIMEEKDLFKSLRLKRNDRGEIVLFSVPEEFKDLL